MTANLGLTPLDDAELATINGGLGPLLLIAATAIITTVVKDFVDHVGDFASGVADGWAAAR